MAVRKAKGRAKVRVEFEDGRVFAFEGEAYIQEDAIEVGYTDPKGRYVSKQHLDRTEVVVHAESTTHSGRR